MIKTIFKLFILISFNLLFLKLEGQVNVLGVRTGLSQSNVKSTAISFPVQFKIGNSIKYEKRNGTLLGLSYEHINRKHFSLGVEVNYNQRGISSFVITDSIGYPIAESEKYPTDYNYNYFSIPVKVGYNLGKKIYGFVNLGVVSSILSNSFVETPIIGANGVLVKYEKNDITNRVNKFDFAGIYEFGVGYKYKDKFWFYSSFENLRSFNSFSNLNYYNNHKIKHSLKVLSLGIKMVINKN
jgi:hypothetical protein